MNIKEAKNGIKMIIETYLDKDTYGNYTIPYMKQRPVFLVGAPGIGKTAIMEQIAGELELPLVSYSMTHHTRQSAIGLPFIQKRSFGGREEAVSEYTMSEIVAAVYKMMEKTGKSEGILFLDEINCVSETLAPAMLLFLQYKSFGGHRIPEGWIIVTAGNPPEYNKSVREFDLATRDRLRCMEVKENFEVWKEYAYKLGIHGSILTFLELHREWFFSIRENVDGPVYVTARGWEDLSKSIFVYEKKNFPVDKTLVGQYITDEEICRKYCIFYDLYKKYRSDYQIDKILEGNAEESILEKARKAGFDERLSLLSLLLDKIGESACEVILQDEVLDFVVKELREIKKISAEDDKAVTELLEKRVKERQEELSAHIMANNISMAEQQTFQEEILCFQNLASSAESAGKKQFTAVKKSFGVKVKAHQKKIESVKDMLENIFDFVTSVWGEKQELTLLMTEVTANANSLAFVGQFGCTSYDRYNASLLIYDKQEQLRREIRELEL